MENQSNQATKKGIILLLGVIIGLLVGVLVTFVMVKKLNFKPQQPVKMVTPSTQQGSSDTIYKYIVHQYESGPRDQNAALDGDSLQVDTAFVEDYSMDYMLEDEDVPSHIEKENTNVSSSKLISKYEAPILYFDASRNAIEAPDNAPKFVEVQFWSTPIQNKIVYQFDGNVLKVKGLKTSEVYVIHYKNHYYLQSGRRVFLIETSPEYSRLTEIREGSFLK